ncbi:predicted protein [Verticillium alfalfae VaMs.102]|uniref:Predicted protein n=1 Tax=Verticillium alfalfae (strain VaMs.102 / ATCC MYA-4576 / FGSC 10136) TaxID=526221 RepID=C9SXN9_VERA1|nr:predicted protein [Verticillium alfalfae VaMs.102]EEY23429.1 predicted protein [Verticillium alfalfae VaMs.102]
MPVTSTLLSLPNEVLIIIAKYLVQPWNNRDVHTWRDGPRAPTPCTANLCLTSKRLRDISKPLLFSQITVKSYLQMLRLLRSLLRAPSLCQKVQSLRVGYSRSKCFPSRKDYDEVLATFKAWADAISEIPGNNILTLQDILKRIEAVTGFDFVHIELISDLDEPTFEALQALSYCNIRQTWANIDLDPESHYSRLQFVIPVPFYLVPKVKALSVIYRTEEHKDLTNHCMADAPKLDHVIACLLADDHTSSKFLPELESLHFQSSAPSTGPQCHVFLPTLARLRSIRHMGAILARPLSQEAFQLISLDTSTTLARTAGLLDVLESCQDLERLNITLESVSFCGESRDEVQVFIDELVDTCLCPKLKEGDMESLMPVLVLSWATVAAAIRAGHLPYLRYGFFLDECLGVLPGEISKVEEQHEETDDGTEETWTDERETDSSPSGSSAK